MNPTAAEMLSVFRDNGIKYTSVRMWTGVSGVYWVALESDQHDSKLGRIVTNAVPRQFKTEPEALAVYQELKTL